MTDSVKFTIPGPAVPQMGSRVSVRGGKPRLRKNPRTKEYQDRVAAIARQHAPPEPWDGPVDMTILISRGPLMSWSKWRREAAFKGKVRPTTRPDLDNISKAIGDALNGIIYTDDSRICLLTIAKRYAAKAEVEVRVTQMGTEGLDK